MKELELTVEHIKDIIKEFNANGLGSLKLSQGGFSLELESRGAGLAAPVFAAEETASASADKEPKTRGTTVKSPIVGTFYTSSAPGGEPYVAVGSVVKKGDVLFIIESMKLMNEVVSEFDGTVAGILVENGAPVEYGQPILIIK